MSATMAEKIFSRLAGRGVRAGEFVEVAPDWTFSLDDGIGLIEMYLDKHRVPGLAHPQRVALFFDHYAPADTPLHGTIHKKGRDFARKHNIRRLHDVGDGISHQVAVETRLVEPGQMAVNTDSHTMTIGAVGAMGMGIGASEMAFLMTTGKLWFRVPTTVRIELHGRLSPAVSPKDAILSLIGALTARGATYKVVEFWGPALAELDMASRMTLCNMATELGAKSAMVVPDVRTREFFEQGGARNLDHLVHPDSDARYVSSHRLDLGDVQPMVACPHRVDNVKPVGDVLGTPVHQAFLGTCTNGRFEDLQVAAGLLKGRRIAPGVRFIVTPASREVYRQALREGVLEVLSEAGCTITTAGCGACAGMHQGALGDEEVCISSSSRNFLGRMGNRTAFVYLGSPATVCASAIAGHIADPRQLLN